MRRKGGLRNLYCKDEGGEGNLHYQLWWQMPEPRISSTFFPGGYARISGIHNLYVCTVSVDSDA